MSAKQRWTSSLRPWMLARPRSPAEASVLGSKVPMWSDATPQALCSGELGLGGLFAHPARPGLGHGAPTKLGFSPARWGGAGRLPQCFRAVWAARAFPGGLKGSTPSLSLLRGWTKGS